jgi:spore maturation protein CgeB
MRIVFIGPSITSSWGNGHATTYRALVRELTRLGHRVTFFECDKPWLAANRDLPYPPYGMTILYEDLDQLHAYGAEAVEKADAAIVGSYVPEGTAVAAWALATARGVTAFYDIDTPVTLAKLRRKEYEYLSPDLIPQFDLYLSFAGGPILNELETRWGAQAACALYCSVDTELHYPEDQTVHWDLGYLGTYSPDRQPTLERFLLEPARRGWGNFAVAGTGYPEGLAWPQKLEHLLHLPPEEHRRFYNSQRFTLNVTRADMVEAGFSPSVRLFEAAACGVPVISDWWEGLDTFFEPGKEIAVAESTDDVLRYLWETSSEEARQMGQAARVRVLQQHTAAHRALELQHLLEHAARLAHK